MLRRNISDGLRTALSDTPVVLLNGARQTGKTTLARRLAKERSIPFYTLDDVATLSAAAEDPVGFLRGLGHAAVIDEVQKVPALFPAIKAEVDTNRKPGRFLLTGSANVFMLPKLSESLAGRMEIVTLWPLSQGELRRRRERFIDCVFASKLPELSHGKPTDRAYDKIMVRGGFPETLQRTSTSRLDAWFRSYVTAIVQKDIRDLASIAALTEMPKLLSLLASRTGELMNVSELSRGVKIPHTTLKRYLGLLETTFLLAPLLPWSANIGKRLTKSPKIHLVDSGLASHLIGITEDRLQRDTVMRGHLLESFVVTELRKQISWSEFRVEIYHFRTVAGREVDVVLEDNQGRVVGVEVKSSATVVRKDFLGLDALSEAVGNKFVRGIVLYSGNTVVPFGERMTAIPISSLWRMK